MALTSYIDKVFLIDRGFEINEDNDNVIDKLIRLASIRINNFTNNKIEETGFVNLEIEQQELVQEATAVYVEYWDKGGYDFIRRGATMSLSSLNRSINDIEDPDWVPPLVEELLTKAGLLDGLIQAPNCEPKNRGRASNIVDTAGFTQKQIDYLEQNFSTTLQWMKKQDLLPQLTGSTFDKYVWTSSGEGIKLELLANLIASGGVDIPYTVAHLLKSQGDIYNQVQTGKNAYIDSDNPLFGIVEFTNVIKNATQATMSALVRRNGVNYALTTVVNKDNTGNPVLQFQEVKAGTEIVGTWSQVDLTNEGGTYYVVDMAGYSNDPFWANKQAFVIVESQQQTAVFLPWNETQQYITLQFNDLDHKIMVNATNIQTNQADINQNKLEIAANYNQGLLRDTKIANNTLEINTNKGLITANATAIAQNVSGILTNLQVSQTNKNNIEANDLEIAALQTEALTHAKKKELIDSRYLTPTIRQTPSTAQTIYDKVIETGNRTIFVWPTQIGIESVRENVQAPLNVQKIHDVTGADILILEYLRENGEVWDGAISTTGAQVNWTTPLDYANNDVKAIWKERPSLTTLVDITFDPTDPANSAQTALLNQNAIYRDTNANKIYYFNATWLETLNSYSKTESDINYVLQSQTVKPVENNVFLRVEENTGQVVQKAISLPQFRAVGKTLSSATNGLTNLVVGDLVYVELANGGLEIFRWEPRGAGPNPPLDWVSKGTLSFASTLPNTSIFDVPLNIAFYNRLKDDGNVVGIGVKGDVFFIDENEMANYDNTGYIPRTGWKTSIQLGLTLGDIATIDAQGIVTPKLKELTLVGYMFWTTSVADSRTEFQFKIFLSEWFKILNAPGYDPKFNVAQTMAIRIGGEQLDITFNLRFSSPGKTASSPLFVQVHSEPNLYQAPNTVRDTNDFGVAIIRALGNVQELVYKDPDLENRVVALENNLKKSLLFVKSTGKTEQDIFALTGEVDGTQAIFEDDTDPNNPIFKTYVYSSNYSLNNGWALADIGGFNPNLSTKKLNIDQGSGNANKLLLTDPTGKLTKFFDLPYSKPEIDQFIVDLNTAIDLKADKTYVDNELTKYVTNIQIGNYALKSDVTTDDAEIIALEGRVF